MDTKLKSIKYSLFTKFVCWLLSVVLLCLSFGVITKIVVGMVVYGPEEFLNNKKTEFFDTEVFSSMFYSDFYNAYEVASVDKKGFYERLEKYKEKTVDEVYDEFINAKSEIIRQELTYAVNNWDTEYYNYEDSVNDVEDYMVTTNVYVTEVTENQDGSGFSNEYSDAYVTVPDYAPANIKMASFALNTAKGTDIIKYAPLVREGAFQGEFVTTKYIEDLPFEFGLYYTLSKTDIKVEIEKIFDSERDDRFNESYSYETSKAYLKHDLKNLKFYLVDNEGNITTNIKEIPSNLSNKKHYILANDLNVTVKGFNDTRISAVLNNNPVNTLCIYFDEDFKADDDYLKIYQMYLSSYELNFKMLLIEFSATIILFFIFLIIFLRLVGKYSVENKKLCFIDKIPNDLHFALSIGLVIALSVLVFNLYAYTVLGEYVYSILLFDWVILVPFAYIIAVYTIFTEWLSSVIRIKRAGHSYFKNTLIYKAIMLLIKIIKSLAKCLSYKPKAAKIRFSIIIALYLIINAFIGGIGLALLWDFSPLTIFFAVALVVFNVVAGYFAIEYVNTLDKIIVASSKREKIILKDGAAPASLKMLADNLSDKNKSIDRAVAEAIKNEQMKTQLITNVSHDLKTPLTSLINYSDLLSKCDLDNEEAIKYVEVINQKSDKLKHLIEDLIEASKASTGNVTLNKTKLNLCELAVQAIVEYTPDIEKNFNTIKFTEPTEAPIIWADGNKTYRIISNLLSNVKKYSASDTRVYVRVYQSDSYGCFEIKNISKEPLDINPEQLTERFVRGDESRANEGNGLGLAIAKDLCSLQNGELEIVIDGDLFKATVKLPLSE